MKAYFKSVFKIMNVIRETLQADLEKIESF